MTRYVAQGWLSGKPFWYVVDGASCTEVGKQVLKDLLTQNESLSVRDVVFRGVYPMIRGDWRQA